MYFIISCFVAICICSEYTFTQAAVTSQDFPAAFSKAFHTYHDSDLRTKVDAEINALRGVDLDNVVPFMERNLVPIIIANRLRGWLSQPGAWSYWFTFLGDPAEGPAVWPVILWVAFNVKANSLPELRSTDIDALLEIIESQSQANEHFGLWQWDETDEKTLRETFLYQDETISSWIDRYPHAWREYIRLLDSRDWARLKALTRKTPRPRLAPTEYDAGIRVGAIVLWISSSLLSTSQETDTTLSPKRFVADMVESVDNNVSQALPQVSLFLVAFH
jgi:hypothetical protein